MCECPAGFAPRGAAAARSAPDAPPRERARGESPPRRAPPSRRSAREQPSRRAWTRASRRRPRGGRCPCRRPRLESPTNAPSALGARRFTTRVVRGAGAGGPERRRRRGADGDRRSVLNLAIVKVLRELHDPAVGRIVHDLVHGRRRARGATGLKAGAAHSCAPPVGSRISLGRGAREGLWTAAEGGGVVSVARVALLHRAQSGPRASVSRADAPGGGGARVQNSKARRAVTRVNLSRARGGRRETRAGPTGTLARVR